MTIPLAAILTSDLVSQVRGRAFPADEIADYTRSGSGWVPANSALDPFGRIITPNPFGSTGDVRLMPDPATATTMSTGGGSGRVTAMLADIVNPDGTPWDCCPRTFLRDAVRDLRDETGLEILSSFEHEFMLQEPDRVPGRKPFSFQSLLSYEPLGSNLLQALREAGLQPEMWLPEYGDRQWEITLAPADAVTAADRAVLLREIVREVARAEGHSATFSPVLQADGGTNGVHIHVSLKNLDGEFVTYDPERPGGLSEVAGSFAAGVLRDAVAFQALTASAEISYERLAPGKWSVGGPFLGERNREALLRICPLFAATRESHPKQYNLEYRGADATSNPWIALGAIIRAGLGGIRDGLRAPTVLSGDVTQMPADELRAASFGTIPSTLSEALDGLERSASVASWLSPRLLETFLLVKRAESEHVRAMTPYERYLAYAEAY